MTDKTCIIRLLAFRQCGWLARLDVNSNGPVSGPRAKALAMSETTAAIILRNFEKRNIPCRIEHV